MGYAKNSSLDTDYGAIMQTAQFVSVNDESKGISLNALVPVCETEVDDWGLEIQCLTTAGETIEDQDYVWIGGKWCSVLTEQPVTDVTFAPGQGLWVISMMGETPLSIQSSGAVCQNDVDVLLDTDYGAIGVGIPFPVAISLDSITPVCETEVDDWGLEIQCLTTAGETIEDQDYVWIGGKWCSVLTEQPVTDVTFAPGQGLWVISMMGETPLSIRIPAPEL